MSDQLEKEFQVLHDAFGKEIESKVEQFQKLMAEAVELSDRYGIPFACTLTPSMRGWYVPDSFSERFASLDKEMVSELTDVSEYKLGRSYGGWQHSNIC